MNEKEKPPPIKTHLHPKRMDNDIPHINEWHLGYLCSFALAGRGMGVSYPPVVLSRYSNRGASGCLD